MGMAEMEERSGWYSSPRSLDAGKDQDKLIFEAGPWVKLQWVCHRGPTEVAGFGVTTERNLLRVTDLVLVPQQADAASFDFDADGLSAYFEDMAVAGVAPERSGRIWIHTHPGDSPTPSGKDRDHFGSPEGLGQQNWACMFILARGGQTHAELRYRSGPRTTYPLPVVVDWSRWPEVGKLLDVAAWEDEYRRCVRPYPPRPAIPRSPTPSAGPHVHLPPTTTTPDGGGKKKKRKKKRRGGGQTYPHVTLEDLLDMDVGE
jgi:proteasome lid subunit RPN8/RPN11